MSEYVAGSVIGLSSLREAEKQAQPAAPQSEAAKQRAEYLKRYASGASTADDGGARKKKKRKKKKDAGGSGGAIRIVEEDADWAAPPPTDEPEMPHSRYSDDEDDGALLPCGPGVLGCC